ncbi:MAG: FAD binding domain-containing protein [Anaerolineales bacterium]
MGTFEYLRPKTIEEAVSLLERGVPLAGGTRVSTARRHIGAAIDLRDLGLTDLKIEKGAASIEAGVSLQAILESEPPLPDALRSACRLEAGWNIRNAATLGGTIMAADGRSPLLTVLLALDAEVTLEPYEQVARSPVDRPIVCVAAERFKSSATIAIGGFGEFPQRAVEAEKKAAAGEPLDSVTQAAASLLETAQDAWASAEYRTAVAGVLVRRILANGGT